MYIHKVMKKKIDIARSSAERDLTISTTKQIEVLYKPDRNGGGFEVENRWAPRITPGEESLVVTGGVCICSSIICIL